MWKWFTYDEEVGSDGEEDDSTASDSDVSPTVAKLDPRVTAATLTQVKRGPFAARGKQDLSTIYFAGQLRQDFVATQSTESHANRGLFAGNISRHGGMMGPLRSNRVRLQPLFITVSHVVVNKLLYKLLDFAIKPPDIFGV